MAQHYKAASIAFHQSEDDGSPLTGQIRGDDAVMWIGNETQGGVIGVNGNGKTTIELSGASGSAKLEGDLQLTQPSGTSVHLQGAQGNVWVGCSGIHGKVFVKNTDNQKAVTLDAEANALIISDDGSAKVRVDKSGFVSDRISINCNQGALIISDGSIEVARADQNGFVAKRPATAVPDYVFDEDYRIQPLEEVARYVSKHKRLPDMPSAGEIERVGVNLADISLRLLKKVEELTLHIIAQDKRIASLEQKLADVE